MKNFLRKNWILVAGILYLLSPLDFLPDFIPGIGASDDVLVLIATLFIRYRQYIKGKKAETIDGEVVEEKKS